MTEVAVMQNGVEEVFTDEHDALVPVCLDDVSDTRSNASPGSDHSAPEGWRSRWRAFTSREPMCTAIAILRLALPVGLSMLVTNLMSFQTVLFCGHAPSRTSNETRILLDAAALATSFANVTGMSLLIGAATACDTLYAQAFGGKNKKSLGIIVQQSIFILGLVCLLVAGLWLNSAAILLAVGQDEAVVREVRYYMDIVIVSLPGTLGFIITSRYLQSQSITLPIVVIGIVGNVVLAGVDYFLVFQLDLGLTGAAWGYVVGITFQPIAAVIYIRWKKLHHTTWPGWSWKALDNWMIFTRLALAGGVMVCLEWWSFEIFLFVAGAMGDVPLAVSAVLYQAIYITVMVSVGMMIATNIIVGNTLGSGEWTKARSTFRVAVVINGFLGSVMALMFVLARNDLGKIFTSDAEVIRGVADVAPYLAGLEVFDYIQSIGAGVIRGAGRQTIGAVSNLIAYYIFAIPLGIPLALKTSLGVKGFWVGMGVGLAFQAIMYLAIIARINWQDESVRAQQRVKDAAGDQSSEKTESVAGDSNPVELLAVMTVGEDGEVRSRIVKTGEEYRETNGDMDGSQGSSDTDALIDRPLELQSQHSFTDDLVNAYVSKEERRRLLKRKLLVLLVAMIVLLVCIIVRVSLPSPAADVPSSFGTSNGTAVPANVSTMTTLLPTSSPT